MKRLSLRAIVVSAILLTFGACTQRILDFTLVSSKNVDMSRACNFQKGKTRIEGKDMAHWIIVIPTRVVSIKEALDRAIESTPGCVALMDGVIYTRFWWIPYVYGREYAIVEGTPLIDPGLVKHTHEIPAYGKIELDNSGKLRRVTSISEAEYLAAREKIVKGSTSTRFRTNQSVN